MQMSTASSAALSVDSGFHTSEAKPPMIHPPLTDAPLLSSESATSATR
jgi:hypothetical protein